MKVDLRMFAAHRLQVFHPKARCDFSKPLVVNVAQLTKHCPVICRHESVSCLQTLNSPLYLRPEEGVDSEKDVDEVWDLGPGR